jgi:hypothetical protein
VPVADDAEIGHLGALERFAAERLHREPPQLDDLHKSPK